MGIPAPIARAMLQEHKFKPITGNGLLIGRQTMPYSVDQAVRMVREEGVSLRDDVDLTSTALIDTSTRYGKGLNYINDAGFFSLFSDAQFKALDVTDYEGADIVHDMCVPIPDSLENSIDFLWNGSCLDNMFDPATALRNTVRLLRRGGRAVLMEIGTPHHNAYTMFSPAYFFDYFALNEFADCKVYSCLFPWRNIHTAKFDLFCWKNYEATLTQFPFDKLPADSALISYVIAEKAADSTWDRNPVQGQYRPDHAPFRAGFSRFRSSLRPSIWKPASPEALDRYSGFLSGYDAEVEFRGTLWNSDELPVFDSSILDTCRRHFASSSGVAAGFPDLGNRWGVFAQRMRSAITNFKSQEEAIAFGQLRCDFDHRGHVTQADLPEIDITRRLLKYQYPKFESFIDQISDSPVSAEQSFLTIDNGMGDDVYRNKIIYFHAMYALTTASHIGEISSVCEIGGGSGGPCWHFLANKFSKTYNYCIIDLPESLFFAEIFLRAAMPDALFFYAGVDALEPEPPLDGKKRITLVPLHLHSRTHSLKFDLIINAGSMAEMTDEWLSFWSAWIDSQDARFFYSSNYFGNPVNRLFEGRSTLAPIVSPDWQPSFIKAMPIMMMLHSGEQRRLAEIIFARAPAAEGSFDYDRAKSFAGFVDLKMSVERYIFGTYLHYHNVDRDPLGVVNFVREVETQLGYTPVELLALLTKLTASVGFNRLDDLSRMWAEQKRNLLLAAFKENYPKGTHSA